MLPDSLQIRKNADGSAVACLDGVVGSLITIQLQRYAVDARANLDSGRGSLTRGNSVHPNFSARRRRCNLSPSDMTVFLMKRGLDFCLAVVADLHRARVGFIAWKPQNDIVLAGFQRQRQRSLARLLVAVEKDIRSWGL